MVPTTKLTSRNSLGEMKGSSASRKWTTKHQAPTTARVASTTISVEPNQSSSLPRSSIIWKAPRARLSMPKPIQSKPWRSFFVSGRKVRIPRAAITPIGTLM